MADHDVKLNYQATEKTAPHRAAFTPGVNPIRVRKGQTILFHLGTGPSTGKIQVTFSHPEFFSAHQFKSGDSAVHVVKQIPQGTRVTYRCELIVDGKVAAESPTNAGGEVVPLD